MTNSREKGKRGERMLRDVLREHGFLKSRRGQQFCGTPDSPDVICDELPSIHWEIKNCQRGNLCDWMDQAVHDCRSNVSSKMPVVAHKRNHRPWLAVLLMDDLLQLLKETDRVI
jgi:Holliday junction resolvase